MNEQRIREVMFSHLTLADKMEISEATQSRIMTGIKQIVNEAIEECANSAKATCQCTVWNCEGESVDKGSILKLKVK